MTSEQWKAVRDRDPACDGRFFCGLKRTKTLCRPSCAARRRTAQGVVVFETLEEGLAAGYRPCARCRPDKPEWRGAKAELASRAEAYLREHYTEKFSLEAVARALYVDRIYLAKSFKEVTGGTLLKAHNALRCREAAELLSGSELSVEIIGHRVGFATPSHFARVFRSVYDCTPTEYRRHYLDSLE